MKKVLVLALAGFLAAGFVVVADLAGAAEYDRYERETPPPPPPPRYQGAPPPPRPSGFHAGPYLFGNIGIFEPSNYYNDYYNSYYGTYGLTGYSSGLSGNAGFGSRLSPIAAVEGTVGYFSADRGPDEASVVPVTIGGRLIIPNPVFEPYLGGGIGVYFASLDEKPVPGYPYPGTDDSDTTIGGYFSLGMDLWLNPRFALNLEGRYQMVQPTFTEKGAYPLSFDLDMSGWELNVGFRINF